MSTTSIRSSGGPPWRWLLPILLVLLIIVLAAVFVFGSRIKDAFSSPTATPAPAVATATPSTPQTVVVTATPGPGAQPGVTTTPLPGGSTPLPGATPPPTQGHLTLGMITHKAADVTHIQARADAKDPNFTYYLNPVQVVQNTLANYGFSGGFQIITPPANPIPTPTVGVDGRPLVHVYVSYQGKKYLVQVVQPGRHGSTGIWLVVTILHSPT